MRIHQPDREEIESARDVVGDQVATGRANMHPKDFLSPDQDKILALLKPSGDRTRTIIVAGSALVVGLGLGWACGANSAAFNSIAQTEMPSPRSPDIKSSGKSDGARRTASPAVAPAGAPVARAGAASAAGARFSDPVISTSAVTQANTTPTAREPMVPVAETRPTTIEGWTVLDVRGGTAVLEGPGGVQTAARGDTVPGIGRIDSIVRWGNRWIVATASGLIATP